MLPAADSACASYDDQNNNDYYCLFSKTGKMDWHHTSWTQRDPIIPSLCHISSGLNAALCATKAARQSINKVGEKGQKQNWKPKLTLHDLSRDDIV